RRCFQDEVSEWIENNEEEIKLALIFLDLNRFSYINDTLGHREGDRILQAVSKRLSNFLSKQAQLYRFGGDEFIIVIKGKTKVEVADFAKQISMLFDKPFCKN